MNKFILLAMICVAELSLVAVPRSPQQFPRSPIHSKRLQLAYQDALKDRVTDLDYFTDSDHEQIALQGVQANLCLFANRDDDVFEHEHNSCMSQCVGGAALMAGIFVWARLVQGLFQYVSS